MATEPAKVTPAKTTTSSTAQDGPNTVVAGTPENPTPEGAQDVLVLPPQGADEAVALAPAPGKGDTLVSVGYPTDRFVVEGHPVLTQEGTKLSASAAKVVVEAALANGVRVFVNGEEAKK